MTSKESWIKAQKAERRFWLEQKEARCGQNMNFWNCLIFKPLAKFLFASKRKVLLDVGCGPAGALFHMNGYDKVGLDPLANIIKQHFITSQNVQLVKGVGEKLPFRSKVGDLMFCINVLDHTISPDETLAEIRRVLNEKGLFILHVNVYPYPFHLKVWDRLRPSSVFHPHHFTSYNVERILRGIGFKTLETIYTKPNLPKSRRDIGSIFRLLFFFGFYFSKSMFAQNLIKVLE